MRLVLVCTNIALKGHLKKRILHSRMRDILNFNKYCPLQKQLYYWKWGNQNLFCKGQYDYYMYKFNTHV